MLRDEEFVRVQVLQNRRRKAHPDTQLGVPATDIGKAIAFVNGGTEYGADSPRENNKERVAGFDGCQEHGPQRDSAKDSRKFNCKCKKRAVGSL